MDDYGFSQVASSMNQLSQTIASARAAEESSDAYLQAMRETNDMNYKIAQETNQANLDMYNKQFSDSVRAWQMQNAYNDPSAQRARMSAAGFNPALALGQSEAAGSVSMPSSAPAVGATMQVAPYEAYKDSALSSLGQSLAQIGNSQEQFERIRNMRIDNNTRDAYNQVNINNMMEDLINKRQQRNLTSREAEYIDSQIEALRLLNRLNADTYMDAVDSRNLDNEAKRLNMRLSKEANDRDAARLVIESLNSQSQRALNEKTKWQIGEMVRIANNADWRDNVESLDKSWLSNLDRQLKQLQLSENDKQFAFNELMRNLTSQHEVLKSKSYINKAVEYCFGLGFRDLGNSLKEFLNSSK